VPVSGEADEYRLENGPNPCDVCVQRAGVYPSPPDVPFHVRCDCSVVAVKRGDDRNCRFEIRNPTWDSSSYYEEAMVVAGCTEKDDVVRAAPRDLTEQDLDPELEEAAIAHGWDKPVPATAEATADVPAGVEIEVWQTAVFESVLLRGERWRICPGAERGVETETLEGTISGWYSTMVETHLEVHQLGPCGTPHAPEEYIEDSEARPGNWDGLG
jgi:hypothetical protein